MILLYLIFFLLLFYGITPRRNGYYEDFLGKNQCNAIKGLCIVLVFIRHIFGYIYDSGYDYHLVGDHYADILDGMTRQLLVAYFLFISGYGIMESIKAKGEAYINVIPRRRILNTLLNFDVAILLFILLDLVIHEPLSIKQIALSLICWDSVGNSNWYIFAILMCYSIVYVVFKLSCRNKVSKKNTFLLLFLLFLFYLIVFSLFKTSCWYDTIFCYPAGMLFSQYKGFWARQIQNHNYLVLFTSFLLFNLLYLIEDYKGIIHNVYSIILCIFIVTLTMKVRIGNKAIYWMGVNLFPLYIYQRLPMLAIYSYDEGAFVRGNVIAYIMICAVSVIGITYLYKFWQIKIR